jgi:hypothetical protein
MNILTIIGENGVAPQLCNQGGCPAAILTDDDTVVIQGYIPTEADRKQLRGPAGEDFVKMPRAVFEKIARQVLKV